MSRLRLRRRPHLGRPRPGTSARRRTASWQQRGFTLIEILVASTILLIVISTSGFLVSRYIVRGRVIATRNQIDAFALAATAYFIDAGRYPTQEQGLDALWQKPILEPVPKEWDGPYLDKPVPDDSWGNPFVYRTPGPNGLPYEIVSLGADGLEGGDGADGDLVSWQS